ncbi:peptide-methionine (S)-S-oxide reductase MsrA [Acidovorax sp. SUPP3334]|uniref:peptide-methionine (S)-S-oxide reductase MsrA n=1 Tax=Acidovorax sp. SUPP3334 TaxID=2920881 RepID=UPI0023DE379A|nr:peptide-methionine (S)-S-oxide reductase MsrA [Acidovorax sp. SUPP3334]GKT25820.1 peptide-methionine (S)-S-oxide reductase MsrA [Acidovorax sp. SUPP3334]
MKQPFRSLRSKETTLRGAAIPRRPLLIATLALTVGLVLWEATPLRAAEPAVAVPAPIDNPASTESSATAVFAGGCFWGVQGVFQHVQGVSNAVSGYAGGDASSANYNAVGSGRTGHAEAVRITYDPRQVSYGQLLQIFFSVVHDPTQLNRQGPDTGSQYRSAIFPSDAAQEKVARGYIAQLESAKIFSGPVVTRMEPDKVFYPAEAYHQDYLVKHPDQPYIVVYDLPKVEQLKKVFPGVHRSQPMLVSRAM